MKIGIDGRAAKWYRGTGIGTYTHQLLTSLNAVDKFNDYLIFLPDGSSLKDFNDNFVVEAVKTNNIGNFWDNVRLPNILDTSKMELYHVPQNGVGLSDNIACNKAITLHDIIPLRMPHTVSDRYLKIFNDELPKIIESSAGIITVSQFSKQDIAQEFNFPKDKIYVTPLAAEKIYKPINKKRCFDKLNKKYGLYDDFILYVGGFSPRKNIIGLIEAFSILPECDLKNTKLVITGKRGISYDKYKRRAEELNLNNNVIFTDFIPIEDLPLFYNAAEMLVYPSFYEGFGLPPLEAMACGTPVIASNVTSLPEVCLDSAMLVDPYNVKQLSYCMQQILNDPKLKINMKKKSLIRSMSFSWNSTALGTISAYKAMIS